MTPDIKIRSITQCFFFPAPKTSPSRAVCNTEVKTRKRKRKAANTKAK
uniref:Uncharacterized protein n=1 Tax=Acinetobacter baumannii TaxID=470 RepID=A0A0N7FVW1_ACIBA|nr:hypothetical protein [Acinetobacter baumannii]